LGLVGEGHEVLTAGGIEPRWTGRGDRRGGLFLGKKQRSGELERGGRRAAAALATPVAVLVSSGRVARGGEAASGCLL